MVSNAELPNGLIAIDKTEGLTTHQTQPGDWGVLEFYGQKLNKKLYPVHRLDKETSGILLAATTAQMAKEMFPLFENRKIQKFYFTRTIENGTRTSGNDRHAKRFTAFDSTGQPRPL